VDEVITIVFDEEIDEGSITDSSIMIYDGGDLSQIEWTLNTTNNHSVLSIRPYGHFSTNENINVLLGAEITDTLGNAMGMDVSGSASTFDEHYTEMVNIDTFRYATPWESPTYSGSTVGVIGSGCDFNISCTHYVPASTLFSARKRSAYLQYQWDTAAGSHLLREYLSGGDPRNVTFDNSYILQCYVYGDGSHNKFRFAIDEAHGSTWPDHEVSQWWTLDWEGWRLLEWDLSDPSMVGSWLGDEILNGSAYRIDSFQMTYDPENGAASGRIFVDNLRVVKRMPGVSVEQASSQLPQQFAIHQNYPNPFNPETQIDFDIPEMATLTMNVYDITGRLVKTLIDEQTFMPGSYKARFHAENLAAGVYFVRLESPGQKQVIRMTLLK
jgi:hypothetical protein